MSDELDRVREVYRRLLARIEWAKQQLRHRIFRRALSKAEALREAMRWISAANNRRWTHLTFLFYPTRRWRAAAWLADHEGFVIIDPHDWNHSWSWHADHQWWGHAWI